MFPAPTHVPGPTHGVEPTREPVPGKAIAAAPVAPKPVAAKPVAPKAAGPKPAPKPETIRATGKWRVQLGAFRDQGNAETLWTQVRGKLRGAQPFYVRAGSVTRLQAGGFTSKADASRACAAAGTACVVVAP